MWQKRPEKVQHSVLGGQILQGLNPKQTQCAEEIMLEAKRRDRSTHESSREMFDLSSCQQTPSC